MRMFKRLQSEEIFWNEIREYVKERERKDECIYCGEKGVLTIDHLFPRSLNGPEDEKNVVWVCSKCNSSKGNRRVYEYWTIKEGLDGAKYNVPRIAEGKYLKFIYETLKEREMLNMTINDIIGRVCPNCDLPSLCAKEDSVGKLSPLCLDGILTLCFGGI